MTTAIVTSAQLITTEEFLAAIAKIDADEAAANEDRARREVAALEERDVRREEILRAIRAERSWDNGVGGAATDCDYVAALDAELTQLAWSFRDDVAFSLRWTLSQHGDYSDDIALLLGRLDG